uniref:Reverse transcriptase Ty1/copia-type domain-containing protein n=1 Tax=Strigamia maritima TaxID=126957 RepID=T1ILJ9_STRMM
MIKVPVSVGITMGKCKQQEIEADFPYRSLVGSLLFVASRTRPDILYSVIHLSQYNNAHLMKHVKCLKQVLQYLVNTSDYCINLSRCKDDKINIYTDAAADYSTCKSFGGFMLYIGCAVVSWGCKKQTSIACSSMESEFVAMVHAVKEGFWLSSIFENCPLFGYVNVSTVFSDSMAAINFTNNDIENTKTRHIRIRYYFLRDWFEKNYFALAKVPGSWNVSDLFTKWVSGDRIRMFDRC